MAGRNLSKWRGLAVGGARDSGAVSLETSDLYEDPYSRRPPHSPWVLRPTLEEEEGGDTYREGEEERRQPLPLVFFLFL